MTTATPVVYDTLNGQLLNAAPMGHAMVILGREIRQGRNCCPTGWRTATLLLWEFLSAANRGLPARSCAVWFESAEFPATYGVDTPKLWLVDCCDDAAVGTLYQASAPDWEC